MTGDRAGGGVRLRERLFRAGIASLRQESEESSLEAITRILDVIFKVIMQAQWTCIYAVEIGVADDGLILTGKLSEKFCLINRSFVISQENDINRDRLIKNDKLPWI